MLCIVEALVNAVSEFLAAIFARFGYVGRPRRRANIRDDLGLLDQIRDSPDFGADSRARRFLADHITAEVARYSGVDLKRKRKIPWGTVAVAMILGLPLTYLTYKLNQQGFSWFSLLPGAVAFFFVIGGLAVLFTGDDSEQQSDDPESTSPSSGSSS